MFIRHNLNKRRVYRFYGGEPLLYKELFKKVLKIILRHDTGPYTISIITNGTLIDEKIVKLLKELNINIAISLDGPENINDLMRIKPDGSGSYHEIVSAINLLRKFNIRFRIACTIHKHNINHIKESLIHILNITRTKYIDLNIPIARNRNEVLDPQMLFKALLDALNVSIQKHAYISSKLTEALSYYLKKEPPIPDCFGCGIHIIYSPGGYISPCAALTSEFIDVNNIRDLNELDKLDPFKTWNERLTVNIPKCLKCKAINICGGECPLESKYFYNNIHIPVTYKCELMKYIYHYIKSFSNKLFHQGII